MIYFPEAQMFPQALERLLQAGLDVSYQDLEMTDQDEIDAIIACDVLLIVASYDTFGVGFQAGVALAFGKTVYGSNTEHGHLLEIDGYREFPSLRDACEAIIADEAKENQDDVQLDGDPGTGTRGDTEAGGNTDG